MLAVAQKLKDRLSQGGRYDVYMTRTRDVFISLDEPGPALRNARR